MHRWKFISLIVALAVVTSAAPAVAEELRPMSREELVQALDLILGDLAILDSLDDMPTKVRHYPDGTVTVSVPLTPELIERFSAKGPSDKSAINLVTLMAGHVRGNANTNDFEALPNAAFTALGSNYFAWVAVANFGSAGRKKATATIKGPGPTVKRSANPRWDAQSFVFVFLGNAMRIEDGGVWQNTTKVKTGGNVKYRFVAQ